MERLAKLKPVITFHLIVNVLIVLFITGASYYHVPFEGFRDRVIYFAHLLALQTTVAGFLYFVSLSRWLFRIVFSVLFLIYCGFSFWAYSQDISITPALIQGVAETKPDIAIDIITWPFAVFYAVVIVALIGILKYYNRIEPRSGWRILIVPAFACVILYFAMERSQYGIFNFRLPYNVITGVHEYYEKPPLELNKRFPKFVKLRDSVKVVFVLGETVRADHLGLNGYTRNTTELLSGRPGLISFPNLYTSKTVTATSVPQILTDQKLDDEFRPVTSVYDPAKLTGYHTVWIGNQTLEKSFLPITETNDEVILLDKYRSVFSFDKELDEVMLKPMDSLLSEPQNQLITIHMIGSHWWYENRYTSEHRKFTPVIDSKYIPSLTKEQMINSYDNTIVYLDFFLNEIIKSLEEQAVPTAMIYISDHGELLGEDGRWLHAQKGEALTNPAYMIWLSESYREKYPDTYRELIESKDDSLTTDSVYYTLLNILRARISN